MDKEKLGIMSRIKLNILFVLVALFGKNHAEVVYAVNCGGSDFVDVRGVFYSEDPSDEGTASDYGKHLFVIGRVPSADRVLYDTERYHTSNFGYDLPVEVDGDYILQLKFCEVYFNEERKKVFDVVLNSEHTIIGDLDIFANVGKGNAHDEYIKFSVSDGKLFWKDEESEVFDGKVRLDFMKGNLDNPKCNAFILYKGEDLDNIPKLKEMAEFEEDVEEAKPISEEEQANLLRVRRTSGPKQPNPYSTDDPSSIMMPVLIAVACFIPLLFCLCKL